MTRKELIESLIKWTRETNVDWEIGWEDEGFLSINFPYDLEENDEEGE